MIVDAKCPWAQPGMRTRPRGRRITGSGVNGWEKLGRQVVKTETGKRAQKRRDLKIYQPRARPVLAGPACGARQVARFYAGRPQFFSGLQVGERACAKGLRGIALKQPRRSNWRVY